MQASTPQTAKKQSSSRKEIQELSQQLEEQILEAKATMTKMQVMQESAKVSDQPPYIQEMQQQLVDLQERVRKLEQHTERMQRNITDVDILTQHLHDAVYNQQQREAARQTVAKGWPQDFTDEERDQVISWYMEKAGVDSKYTTSHGRYMHGRYKRSPVTIIHWQAGWAKHTSETYMYKLFKRYNKHNPVTVWDRKNKTLYYGNQPHGINFVPQTSEMEREINLTIHAALHIVTKDEHSDLASTWHRVAVKWQDKLAVRTADKAVIFKLLRDKGDAKYMYLHIHRDYFDIVNENWSKGWAEANVKTKCPSYSEYAYMLKFAVLRSNEEYYVMRDAKWGDKHEEEQGQHEG